MTSVARVFALLMATPGGAILCVIIYMLMHDRSHDKMEHFIMVLPFLMGALGTMSVSMIVFLLAEIADRVERS